jgi:hypothetical protein
MAVRRAQRRYDLAGVREYLASEHATTVLRWALELDDDVQVARSRAYIAAVRAGKPVEIHWYELPEGAFPRGGHNPCDCVIVGDGGIRWAEEG